MKLGYLDCSAGISGDMFLSSLISLGLPETVLYEELHKLPVHFPEMKFITVNRCGINGTLLKMAEAHEHHHRHYSDLVSIIDSANFQPKVTENAIRCFRVLAEAEAKIHGVSVDEVHFHEVGAVDAIVDIVGACIGLQFFQIEKLFVSPIRVGFGTVKCAHGEIPLPAPAAAELLSGFSLYPGAHAGEWTTPTGAALLKSFAVNGAFPPHRLEKIGYGAGGSERAIPNVLRLFLFDSETTPEADEHQMVLETNIDDMNPEFYGYIGDKLLKLGARDYYYTPVQMKKGRPGVVITIISPPEQVQILEDFLLAETSTLGVRRYPVERRCLRRDQITVNVEGMAIRVKIAYYREETKFAPEYEDCVQTAQKIKRPLRDIYEKACIEARTSLGKI